MEALCPTILMVAEAVNVHSGFGVTLIEKTSSLSIRKGVDGFDVAWAATAAKKRAITKNLCFMIVDFEFDEMSCTLSGTGVPYKCT